MEFTVLQLKQQSDHFKGTAGSSEKTYCLGFRPAFLDSESNEIHLCRFADGRLANLHVLDGLPENVIIRRDTHGKPAAIKASLVSGFEKDGMFFTREECMKLLREKIA